MTFKEYVLHQLREMRRELLIALEDVSEENMLSFEPAGHWPIAWIAEHVTATADRFLVAPIHGEPLLEYHDQVARWPKRPPQPGDEYQTPSAIVDRWKQVCDWICNHVESIGESALQESPGPEPYIHSVLRIINHTNSHLRSLWCILGQKRVYDKWPEQQPFLA